MSHVLQIGRKIYKIIHCKNLAKVGKCYVLKKFAFMEFLQTISDDRLHALTRKIEIQNNNEQLL